MPGPMEENREAQDEEKLALTSIYTKDFLEVAEDDSSGQISYHIRFRIGAEAEEGRQLRQSTVILTIWVPPGYPSIELPAYTLKEAYGEPKWVNADDQAEIKAQLQELFDSTVSSAGDEHGVVLFEWIEWLKSRLEGAWLSYLSCNPHLNLGLGQEEPKADQLIEPTDESQSLTTDHETDEQEVGEAKLRSAEEFSRTANSLSLHHSKEPLVDRKSVFVGHVAPVSSVEDVQRVSEYLLSNPKIAKATHNIMAYRIVKARAPSKGKHGIDGEIVLSDYDDDGENAAGGRLLHLLEVCDCRNVVVVVSRWYGGTLLGPQRFKDINNVARQLLQDHGYIK